MNSVLKSQIERMQSILAKQKQNTVRSKPAKTQIFKKIEADTGIVLDDNTREFFRYSNGSNGKCWAAVKSDQIQPLTFTPLEEALSDWRRFSPYDKSVYDEWNDDSKKRDVRIRPLFLRHKLWFPLADFNGGSTQLLYDADPTKRGRFGQIIVYQHDPDAIHYVAESFVEFLKKSNDLLEKHADELLPIPEGIRDVVWKVCEVGNLSQLKELLSKGVPLKIQRTIFDKSFSLLEHAAIYGHLKIVKYLFDQGLPIGGSLIIAAEMGHAGLVEYLISKEARIEKKSAFGETALMRAARFGRAEVVKVLLKHKAGTKAKNQNGQTAVDLAEKNKHSGNPAATIMALKNSSP